MWAATLHMVSCAWRPSPGCTSSGPSMLSRVLGTCSFLWSDDVPLCGWTFCGLRAAVCGACRATARGDSLCLTQGPPASWGGRTPPRALQQGSWAPASPSSPVLVEHPGCLRWPLVVLVSASLVTRGVRHLFLGSWATCVSGEVSAQVPGSFLNWVVSLFGCERYFIFQYKSLER